MMATEADRKQLFQYQIGLDELGLDRDKILQAMGYGDNQIQDDVCREIDNVLQGQAGFPGICGGFRVLYENRYIPAGGGFRLDDLFFETGETIAASLCECDYMVFFAATAGETVSRRITDLNRAGEMLLAYIYDVIGSEIAEAACDYLQARLEEEAGKRGLGITNRYSPGYCGWDVREQHKLFSFLPARFCGITLMESALMVPLKSVSGVIGIGRNAIRRNYGCAVCTLENCHKRKQEPAEEH